MLRFVLEHSGLYQPLHRREFLRIGSCRTIAGCSWGQAALAKDLVATRPDESRIVRRAKSVIVVFASGGQSQLEMWDPKPQAPREVRGEFGHISTAVPGTILGEHLPHLATLADKYALIRSMSHADYDHGSAVYLALTGQYHSQISSNPPAKPTDLPSMMSVFKRVSRQSGAVDQAVQINGPAIVAPQDIAPGQFGGLLGREFDPMLIGNVNTESAVVPGLTPQSQLPIVRIRQRESLLAAIDRFAENHDGNPLIGVDGHYRKAFELLHNSQARQAFDLSAEPDRVRLRYGRNRSGQACLLARRLAEAGVPLITVVWNHQSRGQDQAPEDDEMYGWDTHNDIFDVLRDRLLPRFDQSFSALLEDLEERGMLEETLVICMGEFGRAPLVALEPRFAGATPGRKHWAAAYSILMAGAGVARGKIVGKTDRHGAYPASESFGPWDVTATIFAALGIDPAEHYFDPAQRPFPVSRGMPILSAYEG